ncbi:hypothetical protein ABTI79_20050, partial [Acinetobacter baumannii]
MGGNGVKAREREGRLYLGKPFFDIVRTWMYPYWGILEVSMALLGPKEQEIVRERLANLERDVE